MRVTAGQLILSVHVVNSPRVASAKQLIWGVRRGEPAATGADWKVVAPCRRAAERASGALLAAHHRRGLGTSGCDQQRVRIRIIPAPRRNYIIAVSHLTARTFNDRNDTHDRYTTSLARQQHQEQASAYHRRAGLRDYSRPSSSSGSAHTLRREPRLDDLRPPSRLRAVSVDSPSRTALPSGRSRDLERSPQRPSHRRATSAFYQSQPPHPALRISKRTRSAVLYALEEALRHPNSFTPDLDEENAQMSDLGGGRATNGGSRTSGPVPVSGTPSGIRTPRDVMRDRNAREARRQEEQKAEEARRVAEERRRNAERRAAAVAGGVPRFSQSSSQYSPDVAAQQGAFDGAADRRSGAGRVSGADVLGEPVSRTQEYPAGRVRGPSLSQQDQPRPVQSTAGASRRLPQSQPVPRQPSVQATGGASSSSQAQRPLGDQRGSASTFPHAFERWETLSSHWEGLTSYWLHKLEQNTDEIRNTVPNASTLSRQITDLSAAGANLFHAVVELQRLRASSERKFQRWFFETRADTERNSEMQAQLERQLRLERSAREEAATKRAEAEEATATARREVNEMRRELAISKEEARRAWEELGRRNQDALDTADSLKSGRIAVVAGVQVVPYFGGPSRSGTGGSQRPATREGQPQYGSVAAASSAGAAGLASPGDEQGYYREDPSPSNTDPFTERKQQTSLHHEPETPSLAAGGSRQYPAGATPVGGLRGQPASGSSLGSSRGGQTGTGASVTAQDAQRFYQHPPSETFLHSPQSSSQGHLPAVSQAPRTQREDLRSEGSYLESEGETEYAIDASGNIIYGDQGRPLALRGRRDVTEERDDLSEQAARHERELAARYGPRIYGEEAQILPEAPSVPATSSQAMASYAPTTSAEARQERPDYEGEGYIGWESVQTRHHHPTRLSDVLEEEEERSSRQTRD